MKKLILICAMLGMVSLNASAQQPIQAPDWDGFRFLLGQWVGDGTGVPGEAKGWFTFNLDLQGRILSRRNWADYPATRDRPSFSHDDLMLIYQDAESKQFRADYYDNEGHVIRYSVNFLDNGRMLQFLSEAAPSRPRFRFTYTRKADNVLAIEFEIAPPGKPDAFSKYISATAHRKPAR